MLLDRDWELWLDVHISPIIAKWLKDETGLIVKSSFILNLQGLDDLEIYHLAKKNPTPVILISKDSDFPTIISRLGSPPKLIYLRIGNTDNRVIYQFITKHLQQALQSLMVKGTDRIELFP